jgi:molecular chaperone GrpE
MTQDNEHQDNEQAPPPAPEERETPAPEEPAAEVSAREAELEAEVARLKDQVLRAMAETENVRRRLEQQAEDRGKFAVAGFAKDMLPVADNLRRALDSVSAEARQMSETADKLMTGVELTERELLTAFERYGIRPVAALGGRFDLHLHQAMMEIDDPSKPAGTVVTVMQAGYTLHDRLLRPAMVAVSKGGPKEAPLPAPEAGGGDGRVDTQA